MSNTEVKEEPKLTALQEEDKKLVEKYVGISFNDLRWIRKTYGLNTKYVAQAKGKARGKMITPGFMDTLHLCTITPTDKTQLSAQAAYTYYDFKNKPISLEYNVPVWMTEGCIDVVRRLAFQKPNKTYNRVVDEEVENIDNLGAHRMYNIAFMGAMKDKIKK